MEKFKIIYEAIPGGDSDQGFIGPNGYKLLFPGTAAYAQLRIYKDDDGMWWGARDRSNPDGEYVHETKSFRMGDEAVAREWLSRRLQLAADYERNVNNRARAEELLVTVAVFEMEM